MKYTIEVTADDIAKNTLARNVRPEGYNRACHCPVALAVRRVINDAARISLIQVRIPANSPTFPFAVKHILLPSEVIEKISLLDSYQDVEPFTFTLEVPDEEKESNEQEA